MCSPSPLFPEALSRAFLSPCAPLPLATLFSVRWLGGVNVTSSGDEGVAKVGFLSLLVEDPTKSFVDRGVGIFEDDEGVWSWPVGDGAVAWKSCRVEPSSSIW